MYPVSVPAAACDLPPDCEPDKKNLPATKADLKLVEIRKPETAPPAGEDATAPQGLAAKILQMHAAAEDAGSSEIRRPRLVDPREETALDMPEVLQRAAEETGIPTAPREAARAAGDGGRSSASLRRGPGFRTMLAGTLFVLACGGGAIALGMGGFLGSTEDSSYEVETQLITAEPTIESLIDSNAAGQDTALPRADTGATADASGLEIARAKEQLREAFAARGISSQAPLDPATEAPESKIQARMVTPQPAALSAPSSSAPALPAPAPIGSAAPEEPAGEIQQAQSDTAEIPVPPEEPAEAPAAVAPKPEAQAKPSRPTTPAALAMEEAPPLLDDQGAPPAAASLSGTGRIVSAVNLRQSASKNSSSLGVIPANAEVRFGDCGTWWCNVVYDGKSGYVGKNFLKKTAAN